MSSSCPAEVPGIHEFYAVIPAKAGIQGTGTEHGILDTGLRRYDESHKT
jgi:hypothetical protein